MRLRSFIPSLGMMLLAAGQAGAEGVLIDKSEIRFVSKQMGINVEGSFRRWKANIVFLPGDLAHSKADFDIELFLDAGILHRRTEAETAFAQLFVMGRPIIQGIAEGILAHSFGRVIVLMN